MEDALECKPLVFTKEEVVHTKEPMEVIAPINTNFTS